MYKKLREIFNWFQQKAIRRMNLKNVLNEYYYRMDSSGLPTSGTMYKRQAVVYREKTIDDWIMSVTAATDPDDPRRGLLYRFFQSLYNDEHLQTTIDNRVLPVQQAKYNLVDENDNEDEEAKKLLDRPWFHQLIRICFLHQLQGVSLADLSHLDDNLEISHVEEIPMSNYIPQQQIIIREESDQTGWSYKDGALLCTIRESVVAGDAQRTGGHHSCQEIRIGGMDELYRKIWCSARLCYFRQNG